MATHSELPHLAAGVRVVPRGRDRLQAGISLDRQVIVPTGTAAAQTLEALGHGRRPADGESDAGLLDRLGRVGLLAPPTPPRGRRVVVTGDLGGGDVSAALAAAGLRPGGRTDEPCLLLCNGEPERELLDPWVRQGRAHLVVRVVDGLATIGPFVVPGETACLRCIDAHRHDADPEYVAVLHRYIHAPRLDGCADAASGAVTTLALAWAARELVLWLDGNRPATLSTTITLTDDGVDATVWLRHAECACGWGTCPDPPEGAAQLSHE